MKRICKKCLVEKDLTEFVKANNCLYGYKHSCKECKNKLYVKKGPCKSNPSWFSKGHKFISGAEKGWFRKGQKSIGAEFVRGKKPHNYIDGKGKERARAIRKLFQGKKALNIRLKVLDRDGYKCTLCKEHKERLHVHHVVPLRIDASKAYDIDNLITVCVQCHAKEERRIQIIYGNKQCS